MHSILQCEHFHLLTCQMLWKWEPVEETHYIILSGHIKNRLKNSVSSFSQRKFLMNNIESHAAFN